MLKVLYNNSCFAIKLYTIRVNDKQLNITYHWHVVFSNMMLLKQFENRSFIYFSNAVPL